MSEAARHVNVSATVERKPLGVSKGAISLKARRTWLTSVTEPPHRVSTGMDGIASVRPVVVDLSPRMRTWQMLRYRAGIIQNDDSALDATVLRPSIRSV